MTVQWYDRAHSVARRTDSSVDRLLARSLLLVVIVLAVFAAAYVFLKADNIRLSQELWETEVRILELQSQNQQLKSEIARLSSIPVLQERSVALGYQPAESVEFMVIEEP